MKMRTLPANMAVFGCYIGISIVSLDAGASWRSKFIGIGGDPLQFVWFLNWWPYAVGHQLNPFITKFVWFPRGFNITWATSIPFGALMMLPVTLIGGALLSFNILTALTAPLSAFAAFILARAVTKDWLASLIGGFIFGFSPYEMGQRLGHLNLECGFLIPVFALLCVHRFHGAITRKWFIAGMALLLLAQLGLSIEILATLDVFALMTWAIFWHHGAADQRRILQALAADYAAAGVVTLILAAPFFYFFLRGLPDVPPVINLPSWYSTDLLNFVVPTGVTAVGGGLAHPLARHFTGSLAEQGGYLGLPLILIMSCFFIAERHNGMSRALLCVTVCLAVASLGPVLQIAGWKTGIPMPWLIMDQMPIIGNALPGRFSMYVALAACLSTALWLAAPLPASKRLLRLAAALVACVFLCPAPGLPGWSNWPAVAFFTPANFRAASGVRPNLLLLPFGSDGPGMAWQYDAGLAFTQAGGYIGFTPVRERPCRIIGELQSLDLGPDFGDGLAAYCDTHHVTMIVEGPGTAPVLAAAIAKLGWPTRKDSGVTLVSPQSGALLAYHYVLGDYWPAPAGPSWMGGHVEILTHNQRAILTMTGQYGPARLPIFITIKHGSVSQDFIFSPTTRKVMILPAGADISVTARTLFRPHDYFPTADRRHVSIALAIEPDGLEGGGSGYFFEKK